MILTKDQILGMSSFKTEKVSVPEWGEDAEVIIKSLSAKDRSIIEQEAKKVVDGPMTSMELTAKIASMGIVDEHNKRMFSFADVEKLMEKDGEVIVRIFSAIQRISGLDGKEVKDKAKN